MMMIACFAQLQESDPIYALFDRTADEINCLSIKTLLSSYSENLDDVDCIASSYDTDSELSFAHKIPYSKTKAIAAKIDNKKIELLSTLSLDNFYKSADVLVEFAAESSVDVNKDENTQKTKQKRFKDAANDRLEAARRDFDAILKAEARSTEEANTPVEPKDDPLAEEEEQEEASSTPIRAVDEMEADFSEDTDWIILLVIVLALLSIAMGLLTLMSLKKHQNELNILKSYVHNQPQASGSANVEQLDRLKSEDERLGKRLTEFEDILFQIKNKLDT